MSTNAKNRYQILCNVTHLYIYTIKEAFLDFSNKQSYNIENYTIHWFIKLIENNNFTKIEAFIHLGKLPEFLTTFFLYNIIILSLNF